MIEKLKERRKEFGYTCKQLGEVIGHSKEHYWFLEQGKRTWKYSDALLVANALDCSTDVLFKEYYTTAED